MTPHVPMRFAAATWLLLAVALAIPARSADYHGPTEIGAVLEDLVRGNRGQAELLTLARTPGGLTLRLARLGEASAGKPAVLVVANMEGNAPAATEGALELCRLLLQDWQDELAARTWYVLPVGNPDGFARFFARPLRESFVNARPVNEDHDDAVDEDGPEDLNGDGYITTMRQAHPEGDWLPVADHPVLMKKAERAKGEEGVYRLFTEGIDNDGDGEINEDGPGGANPGRNFPHDFRHYNDSYGRWPASEVESRALLEFAFTHPEIALVITFGRSNSLASVPESNRKAEAAGGKHKLPERWARRMGVDPDEEFPLADIVEMARDFTGWSELTEDMVLQWLGVGAAVNPDRDDLPYWTEISERYKEHRKEQGLDGERIEPPGFASGCVEEWAYYQYGVPSFSLDLWTLPVQAKKEEKKEGELTPDDVEKMSNEEFIALGTEKIAAFLAANEAPAQFTADMVIKGLQSGMMSTKKMAAFMRKAKKEKEAGGADETEEALYAYRPDAFLPWQSFTHPTLGEVEIGGPLPYAALAPPSAALDSLLAAQLPFVRQLAGYLPELALARVDVEVRGPGVWKVEAWVENRGLLPFPTHQGKRCKRPTPAVVTLEGDGVTVLEGRARTVLDLIEGSGGTQKATWLVAGREGQSITLRMESQSAGSDQRTVILKGGDR